MTEAGTKYEVTARNKVRLMRQRGSYEKQQVYDILDSALLCNIGYVIDGQPYVTPTAFWREQNFVYWHGSSASRALINQTKNIAVCFTVSHVDGLVVARSGFHSSVNYRSVMAFGHAELVEDADHKRRAMDVYQNRFVPDRTKANRAATDKELGITKLLRMNIDEASAKIRTGQPIDDDEDYALPVWAGVIAFKTVVAETLPDPKNLEGLKIPPGVEKYVQGVRLDEVLGSIYDGDNTSSHG
jgi:nitroimidazol reductase NimA-like FMN-containing flavoprotein (pyridoxamine 5'-phosphate oxidase superfamily)